MSLLTGGFDRPYAFGLTMALAANRVSVDVIGGPDVDSQEMHTSAGVRFLNLYGDKTAGESIAAKVFRVLAFYGKLLAYTVRSQSKVFHILWNNRIPSLDRTLLMLFYKAAGKRVVLTAHNVNAGQRDGNDSWWNRWTLGVQYRMSDHIFVHTPLMKEELCTTFGVSGARVSVIPFGINNSVPHTDMSAQEAKRRLGLKPTEKAILFYGAIRPYKGLEHLVDAFLDAAARNPDFRLIIAGEPKRGASEYWRGIQDRIAASPYAHQVIQKAYFIPDEETEVYFKAADVSALPYSMIFQSGVLVLSYSFGLPVVAADVGSFRDDIAEGQTGYLFQPGDPRDMAATFERYFTGPLYRSLSTVRGEIETMAEEKYSWAAVSRATRKVYEEILSR
jgi:glycosyltransferase involved in cell wall biosynthesis